MMHHHSKFWKFVIAICNCIPQIRYFKQHNKETHINQAWQRDPSIIGIMPSYWQEFGLQGEILIKIILSIHSLQPYPGWLNFHHCKEKNLTCEQCENRQQWLFILKLRKSGLILFLRGHLLHLQELKWNLNILNDLNLHDSYSLPPSGPKHVSGCYSP